MLEKNVCYVYLPPLGILSHQALLLTLEVWLAQHSEHLPQIMQWKIQRKTLRNKGLLHVPTISKKICWPMQEINLVWPKQYIYVTCYGEAQRSTRFLLNYSTVTLILNICFHGYHSTQITEIKCWISGSSERTRNSSLISPISSLQWSSTLYKTIHLCNFLLYLWHTQLNAIYIWQCAS